jgi:L-fuconolactonase
MPPRAFPFEQPVPDYFQRALDLFGPGRMMWGSDFPPVAGREGYANALRFCREQFTSLPRADQDLIFGGVASTVFPVHS